MAIRRIFAVLGIFAILSLASCNKDGCPNKINEVEQPEVVVAD